MPNREIEARFLNIDFPALKKSLLELGAQDLGEDFLTEVIFYDKELKWQKAKNIIVRLRKSNAGINLTYKHVRDEDKVDGTTEIDLNWNT